MKKTNFVQPPVTVDVTSIYKVAKLKEEVAYTDFNADIWKFYMAAKGNRPENTIVTYITGYDENENPIRFTATLREIGKKDLCKTVRAVAMTGAGIFLRRHDVDSDAMREIYCMEHNKPSSVLVGRGNIFSNDSSVKIKCRTTPDLMEELLK